MYINRRSIRLASAAILFPCFVALAAGAFATGRPAENNNFTIRSFESPSARYFFATSLVGWDFSALPGGTGNYGPSPFSPTASDTNVTVGGLTRGAGFATTGTAASANWGGVSGTVSSESAAITAGQFFTFSITAKTGYTLSLSDIAAYTIRRSATGPANYIWQYQVGSGSFIDIGSPINPTVTSSTGNPEPAIDLTGIADLQNVAAGTPVTFRLVAWNSTGGTFYLKDLGNSTSNDLVVDGTVTAITTGAEVSVSGRVVTASGNGIVGVVITVSGTGSGARLQTITSPFGYFKMDGLDAGDTYVVTVRSKRFVFANPNRVVTLNDSIDNILFTAEPQQ